MKKLNPANIIGLREWVCLPELGINAIRAKIDTGARTSTLHATDIQTFTRNEQNWVRFNTHHNASNDNKETACEALLVSRKKIKSSTGHSQVRYVIRTTLALGERVWPVEFTLTCRQTMRYQLLLGSRALVEGYFLVDPAQSHLQPLATFTAKAAPGAA